MTTVLRMTRNPPSRQTGVRNEPSSEGGRCPTCGKPRVQEFRPFCSKRCADVDLNRWLSGVYRVETDERPDDQDLAESTKDQGTVR